MGEWAFLLLSIAANKWRYSFPNFSSSNRRATAAHCRFNLHFLNDKQHRTPFYLYLFHTYHFCGVFRSFAFFQIILIKLYGVLKIYSEIVPLSIMWFINMWSFSLFSLPSFLPLSVSLAALELHFPTPKNMHLLLFLTFFWGFIYFFDRAYPSGAMCTSVSGPLKQKLQAVIFWKGEQTLLATEPSLQPPYHYSIH